MAYALDLDPTQNLGDALPRPIMKNGRMDISFFSAAEGVSYTVEASTDLANWNTEDVVLSAPDAHGRTTGSYTGSSSAAYLRVIARY